MAQQRAMALTTLASKAIDADDLHTAATLARQAAESAQIAPADPGATSRNSSAPNRATVSTRRTEPARIAMGAKTSCAQNQIWIEDFQPRLSNSRKKST